MNFLMEEFNFVNFSANLWISLFVVFLTFCIAALPKKLFNKFRNLLMKRNGICMKQVVDTSKLSEQQIEEIYDGLLLDIRQTFLFNFLILVTSSVATKSLSTDNLLASFTTTSIYIYWFNLDFFRRNHWLLYKISWGLLIINVFILVVSWFIGGDYLWAISFLISVSAIQMLAFKNSLAKKIESIETQQISPSKQEQCLLENKSSENSSLSSIQTTKSNQSSFSKHPNARGKGKGKRKKKK